MAAERREADAYYTEPDLAEAIVKSVADWTGITPHNIVEPSVGGGAFVRALRARWQLAHITGVDIRAEVFSQLALKNIRLDDALQAEWLAPLDCSGVELIVGNPPYNEAQRHIETSIDRLAPGGILAFLLRLSILASWERSTTLWASPGLRYLQPISPRPSYTEDGKTDNSEYGLLIWKRDYVGLAQVLPPLLWKR